MIVALILNFLLAVCPPFGDVAGPALRYEEVIACRGYDSATIYKEVTEYFSAASNVLLDSTDMVAGSGSLKIYNYLVGAVKNPAGEVSFRFRVDVKHEKLRYTMDSIWFQSWRKDRYGRYHPDDEPVPVVTEDFRFSRTVLKKIRTQLTAYIDDVLWTVKKRIAEERLKTTDW